MERPGKLYKSDRAAKIWTAVDEVRFIAAASPEMALALKLAINTGQRQGDLLKLSWNAYEGEHFRLKQSKGNKFVTVPATQEIRELLSETPKIQTTILVNSRGQIWTSDGFRASFTKTRDRAGIEDLTFHDLRGTAVTRLALVGCSHAEIAAITGHTGGEISSILDRHYLGEKTALAENAVTKLDSSRTSPERKL